LLGPAGSRGSDADCAAALRTLIAAGIRVVYTGVDAWAPMMMQNFRDVAPWAVENLNECTTWFAGTSAANTYPGAGTFVGALPANGGTATAGNIYTEVGFGFRCLSTHTIAAGNRPTSFTFTSSLWRPAWLEANRLYDLELRTARATANLTSTRIAGPGIGGGPTTAAQYAAQATVLSTDVSGGAHQYPGGICGDNPFQYGPPNGQAVIPDVSSARGEVWLSEHGHASSLTPASTLDCPPDVHGKYMLREVLWLAANDVGGDIYSLMDEPWLLDPSVGFGLREASFGLFGAGLAAKSPSTYLQRLYTLLGDDADQRTGLSSAPLVVSSGSSIISVPISKSNGRWVVAMWQPVDLMGGTGGPWAGARNVLSPATVSATVTVLPSLLESYLVSATSTVLPSLTESDSVSATRRRVRPPSTF
jgi:hypothetical protein